MARTRLATDHHLDRIRPDPTTRNPPTMDRPRLRTLLRPAIGAAFATAVVAGTTAAASPAAFFDPVRILGGSFTEIDAATDAQGHLHIAAETAGGSIVYVTDRTGSVTKRTVAKAVPGTTVFHDPTLAVDGKGRVHIVYVKVAADALDCGICSRGLYLATDKGRTRGTFGTPTKVAKGGAFAPDLAIHSGKRSLGFMTGMDGLAPTPGTLWFKTDASGAWTATKAATGITNPALPDPSIAVTSDGKARIAFEDGGIKVAFASTTTGGFSVDSVSSSTEADFGPVMLLNASDGAVVVFASDPSGTANDGVYLRGKGGASWAGVKVTGRLGALDAVLQNAKVTVLLGGTSAGTAGTWAYEGPSFPEETIGSAQVRDVALAGAGEALATRVTTPKGIYRAHD